MPSKLLNRVKNLAIDKIYEVSKYDFSILELYQEYLQYKKNKFDILKIKTNFINYILDTDINTRLQHINGINSPYIWGMKPSKATSEKILNAISDNKELLFGEDAFLRCIVGASHLLPEDKKHYQYACGYIVDDLTAYFDATRPSRMEKIINSDFEVSIEQIERSRSIIKKLIDNKISKYNSQPIYEPKIGRVNVPKVLVIDQSYKDYSIIKGLADETTFEKMLNSAINENPDADIIIKTHPDTIGDSSIKPKCYYQNIKSHDNIYRLTDAINPISIIQYVDKVYVCTSQFGFEALMCGKEVHTFGMPFYAGWGLTKDAQKCARRTRKRTLEELFYIAYIYMPVYINPLTNKNCEIEEAIDYLIEERSKYFEEKACE